MARERDQSYTIIDGTRLLEATQRFLDDALADKNKQIEDLINAKVGTRDWCFGKVYDRAAAEAALSGDFDAPINMVRTIHQLRTERVATLNSLARVAGSKSVTLLASDCSLLLQYLE
jgi:hypothetical protein